MPSVSFENHSLLLSYDFPIDGHYIKADAEDQKFEPLLKSNNGDIDEFRSDSDSETTATTTVMANEEEEEEEEEEVTVIAQHVIKFQEDNSEQQSSPSSSSKTRRGSPSKIVSFLFFKTFGLGREPSSEVAPLSKRPAFDKHRTPTKSILKKQRSSTPTPIRQEPFFLPSSGDDHTFYYYYDNRGRLKTTFLLPPNSLTKRRNATTPHWWTRLRMALQQQQQQRRPCDGHVRFSKMVLVHYTYSRQDYNREPDPYAVCTRLTPEEAHMIKSELNYFKYHEMTVHPSSRMNIQFFPFYSVCI